MFDKVHVVVFFLETACVEINLDFFRLKELSSCLSGKKATLTGISMCFQHKKMVIVQSPLTFHCLGNGCSRTSRSLEEVRYSPRWLTYILIEEFL